MTMFSGFMSQWLMPFMKRKRSTRANCLKTYLASFKDIGPFWARYPNSERSPPLGQYSRSRSSRGNQHPPCSSRIYSIVSWRRANNCEAAYEYVQYKHTCRPSTSRAFLRCFGGEEILRILLPGVPCRERDGRSNRNQFSARPGFCKGISQQHDDRLRDVVLG